MPIPVGKADARIPRKFFSYPAFAAISQGTRTRKYREMFEPRIEPKIGKPFRNPLYNENLIIIEIGEYSCGIHSWNSHGKREPWNLASPAIREEELPKPDTVRKVRLLFESAAHSRVSPALPDEKPTKSRADGAGKYNRSSLEKILLCSTSHPKLSVSAGMGKGTTVECGTNSKSFIYAMPDSPTIRWPSFKEHGSRSVSLRSGSSRQSTVSDSSDLSTRVSDFGPGEDSNRHSLFDNKVEERFVSPQIMEELRSRGRSFRFINGRMIDDKGHEIERAKLDPLEIKIYARNYKDSSSSSAASSADDDSRSSSPYQHYKMTGAR